MKCSEGFEYSSGQKTRTCDWRGKWGAPQGSGINCEGNFNPYNHRKDWCKKVFQNKIIKMTKLFV